MCGIAGFTTFGCPPPDRHALLARMTGALRHRGPDGAGEYLDDQIALGHRRLSIIDLEGGAQPMADPTGRYQLVYNGELYNYVELRREYAARGYGFRTHSDTEVLLAGLVLDGEAALPRFSGMFAVALWDRDTREVLLARDRIGIKPLYYALSGGSRGSGGSAGELIFGSELKALLCHPGTPRDLDPLSVSKFFSYGYIPAPHTIFAGVAKLEPGALLRFSRAGLTKACYWDLPLQDRPVPTGAVDDCAAELLGLLDAAVQRHLRSDVPVGVFLSGGIDSSTVAALAARHAGRDLRTFSIGFDQASYDESPYAAEIARRLGTRHTAGILRAADFIDALPRVLAGMDEPFADASILPTYLLSRLAAGDVKVVLGGDGGDELFAGYPSFQAHQVVERLSFLPAGFRDWAARWVRRLPVSHRYASFSTLAEQFLKGLGMPPEVRFMLWMGCYANAEKRQLFSPGLQAAIALRDPFEDIDRYVRQSGLTDPFARLLYLCTKLYLQDGVLAKVDRASMAHSLEVRVPLLDPAVVEYASRIQPFYKLRGLTTKYILKRAVRGLLPRHIVKRRKAGFMMPVAAWLAQPELRPLVEDLCNPAAAAATGLFDARYVRPLLDEHFARRRDHRKRLWPLLCFMGWWRTYGPGSGGTDRPRCNLSVETTSHIPHA